MARTTTKVGGKSRPRPLPRAQAPTLGREAAAHLAGLKAALKAVEGVLSRAEAAKAKLTTEIARVERGAIH